MAPAPTLYGTGHERRAASDRAIRPLVGGAPCLDFLNTVSSHDAPATDDDLSPGYVNLATWMHATGLIDDGEHTALLRKALREPREAAAVRRRAAELRSALYATFAAVIAGNEPESDHLALIERELQLALRHRRLQPIDRRLTWQWAGGADLERLLWPIALDAAELLTSDRMARVRACAAPTCQRLFLDTSKNGSRRFCSAATCGTAERVRRFRARQHAAS